MQHVKTLGYGPGAPQISPDEDTDQKLTYPGMEILPHRPVMQYHVEGYPMDSEAAYIRYVNGTEIGSLKTSDKTVKGAINELYDDLNCLTDGVNRNTEQISTLTNNVTDLQTRMTAAEDAIDGLTGKKISAYNLTYTNPAYFTGIDNYGEMVSFDSYSLSVRARVEQAITPEDGILEVLNVNFSGALDLTKMPRRVNCLAYLNQYDDTSHAVIASTPIPAWAEWTEEINGYDLSIYTSGSIAEVDQYTDITLTVFAPYQIKEEG